MKALTPAVWRIFILVGLSHVALTCVDYRFNAAVQDAFVLPAERLRAVGYVQAAIKAVSFVLQVSAPLFLRRLGLAGTLWTTPVAIVLALVWQAAGGGMSALIVAKVLGKSTDYALFRAGKEMLYVPLSYREKTQGKALVDILGTRAVKGGASLGLWGLVAASGHAWVAPVGLVAALAWAAASLPLTRAWPPGSAGLASR